MLVYQRVCQNVSQKLSFPKLFCLLNSPASHRCLWCLTSHLQNGSTSLHQWKSKRMFMIPENILPVDTASSYVISHSLLWKWSRQQKHAPSAKREKRMNQKTIPELWKSWEPLIFGSTWFHMAHFPTKITAIGHIYGPSMSNPIALTGFQGA